MREDLADSLVLGWRKWALWTSEGRAVQAEGTGSTNALWRWRGAGGSHAWHIQGTVRRSVWLWRTEGTSRRWGQAAWWYRAFRFNGRPFQFYPERHGKSLEGFDQIVCVFSWLVLSLNFVFEIHPCRYVWLWLIHFQCSILFYWVLFTFLPLKDCFFFFLS